MGRKFTTEDLFRIGENNLSLAEEHEFRFRVQTAGLREAMSIVDDTKVAGQVGRESGLGLAERNLLDRIAQIASKFKLRAGGR